MPGKRPSRRKAGRKRPPIRLTVAKALDALESQLVIGRSEHDALKTNDQIVLQRIENRLSMGGSVTPADLTNIRRIARKNGIPLE